MELASLAQLERSHRRHDQVMSELLEAARRLAAGRPADGDLDRVHEAVAYFERSVTRHFLDEEGSLFPRLSTRRPELAAELAQLSAEHPTQIELQAAVAAAARGLDGESRPSAGKELLDCAVRLAEVHQQHVAREDALFRLAIDALTAEDDAEIASEMETRRDRDENGHGGGGGGGGRGRGGGGGRGRGRRDEPQVEVIVESTGELAPVAAPRTRRARAKARAKATLKRPIKKVARAANAARSAVKKAAKKLTAKKPAKKPTKKRR